MCLALRTWLRAMLRPSSPLRPQLSGATKDSRPAVVLCVLVMRRRPVTTYERRKEIRILVMTRLVHDEVIRLVSEEHADRAA